MRTPYLTPLISLALIHLVGCGPNKGTARETLHPVVASANDDPPWARLQSEHFDIATDLDAPDALRAAETLETTRAAILSAAWPGKSDDLAARTSVVIFRDGLEFMQYFEHAAAVFVPFVRPTIVLWGKPDYWEQKTGLSAEASSSLLRHELTHRVASAIYGRQPKWFSEGLAQFIETMTVSADGTKAKIGELFPEALENYRTYRERIGVSDALAWKTYTEHDQHGIHGLYGLSWLMVHYLLERRDKEFAVFQDGLRAGIEPERAWKKAFATLRPEVLDAELLDYAKRRAFKTWEVPIERISTQPATKASITEADVHAIRAQLAISGAGMRKDGAKLLAESQRNIQRALALEPANPLAIRLLLANGNRLSAEDLHVRLQTQLAKRPDDGEAWLLLAETGAPPEREEAARKALALMPGNPEAALALAVELLATGRAKEALPIASNATALAPWDARAHHAYGAALSAVGRCTDAVRAETRAIEVLPDKRTNSPFERELRTRLDEYRRKCGAWKGPRR